MSLDSLIAQKGGQTGDTPTPVTGGLDALIASKGGTGTRQETAASLYEHILFSEKDIDQFSPTQEAQAAGLILDGLDQEGEDSRIKTENRFMLSHLFNIPLDDVQFLETAMLKNLYGEELQDIASSVVNRNLKDDSVNALREIPENLKIGAVGMTASVLENVKRRAIGLAGGGTGIFSDEAIKRQFEAFTPPTNPQKDGLSFDESRLDSIRRDFLGEPRRLPGTLATETFGVVTRLPDMGAKIIRSKQKELQEEQDIATMSNSPITKLARSVVQSGVPSIGVAAGMAILTGNPLVGLVVLGETEGGAAFQKQLAEGGSVRKSLIIGELSEAAEIAGESLVFPKFVAGLKGGISLRKGLTLIAENAGQEGVTGYMQSFLEVYGTETTKGVPIKEAAVKAHEAGLAAVPENAFVGGAIGGLVGGVSTITSIPARRKAKNQIKTNLTDQGVSQKDAATIANDIMDGDGTVAEELVNKMNDDAKRRAFTGMVTAKERMFPAITPNIVAEELDKQAEVGVEAETPVEPVTAPTEEAAAQPPTEAVEGEVEVAVEVTPDVAKKVTPKAEKVEPVLPTKIVSPGQAGPFKVTFKATEGLPATRIIVDPKVRRSVQAAENTIAGLKTKLKQAKADKKQAVINATTKQIEKAQANLIKLKARQEIKLTNTIANAKAKTVKLIRAQKFKDSLRRDAISMIRAIPKELQKDFILRASKVTTVKGIQKLGKEIQAGLERAEKKESVNKLKASIKAIKPNKMLPQFAGPARSLIDSIKLGKVGAEATLKNRDLRDMAQQVIDNASDDSVAAIQAQGVIDAMNDKLSKTTEIGKLPIETIDQITDTLVALRFQNEADTIAAKDANAKEAIRRRKEIDDSIVETPAGTTPAVKKVKLFHDNLESVLDAVAGARAGTYDLWAKSKRATTRYIYDVINDGVDKQVVHNEEARSIVRQILADNGVSKQDILSWSMSPEDVSVVKKAFGFDPKPIVHKFTLKNAKGEPQEFSFTVNELMSVFMHTRNEHNLTVLLEDGMDRFKDGQKEKIRGLDVEAIDLMTDALTKQQKDVARQIGTELMDGFNKDSLNETSVKLDFFEIAKVDRYWPARRSIIRGPKGKRVSGFAKTIEGLGLLRERTGIGNPMRLSGFFETVHNTNKDVSSYVGLSESLREVKAVYTPEVIASLEDAGRGAEAKIITEMIERIEDTSTLRGPLDTIVKRMLGGFAKSKLFLNAKIAPRQQLSSFLISAYVDAKYITAFKGIANKQLITEIKVLSPQLGARADGLQFDRDVGDAFVENELMHYLTGDISLIDKTAVGMKFFDTNAIVDVYRAVKAEVIDKNPNVDINSTEGQVLLKDRFEWVVRHTQPMWHPKDRSLVGSDPRPLVRALTMFMSQREQLVRMINNGITDFANSEKTADDQVRLGRTLGAVAMNMAMFTIYNIAWAAVIQKKDRDVKDLGKDFLKDILSLPFFGKYLASGFDILFNVLTDKPVFRQEFDAGPVEGILKDILIEAIPNYARAGKHFVTGEKYQGGPNRGEKKWKNEILVATDALVDAISSLKGIPYSGAKDIAKSTVAQFTENEPKKKSRRRRRQ